MFIDKMSIVNCQEVISSELIASFSTIPIKIRANHFVDIGKPILSLYGKTKDAEELTQY